MSTGLEAKPYIETAPTFRKAANTTNCLPTKINPLPASHLYKEPLDSYIPHRTHPGRGYKAALRL
ncbi:hypothetical protein CLV83_2807 [Marinobacterium mangrovicola]|uniref:Uncharacterized protein n=1 Tax=Marinobacterium mangrovicola TaxID=1476959 RepID=A0A4R1GC79_9GAMM|nr:hypothetical protein CLV83_2807 [Marinobacterium mangrovicola]